MDFEITPEDLKQQLDSGTDLTVLDVREPWEYDAAHIEGSKLIPMDQIPARVNQELDPEDHIVVICHHGIRSANVAAWLRSGSTSSADLRDYPSHLHINLAAAFRGHGAGSRLVEQFCEFAREKGSRGAHANVREDNTRGRGMFERLGFRLVHRFRLMSLGPGGSETLYTVVYGRTL